MPPMNHLVPIAKAATPTIIPFLSSTVATPANSATSIQPSKKRKRENSYKKCNQCRVDKQKCLYNGNTQSVKCERCCTKRLECSGPVEMPKGRPRKDNEHSDLELSYRLCYLNLLLAPLKIVDDYKTKMMHLCDSEYIFDDDDESFLCTFEDWVHTLRISTVEETLRITAPRATSNSSCQAMISSTLRGFAIHKLLISPPELSSIGQSSDSDHVGNSYLLYTKLWVYDWTKLLDLKNRYQRIMLSIFEKTEENTDVPGTILDSPLPFPETLLTQGDPAEAVAFAEAGWIVDCLGRSLLHLVLETAKLWDYVWDGVFRSILDRLPHLIDSQDLFGRTALYVSCEQGRYKAVLELLSRNVDMRIRSELGLEPLHIAAARGHTSICSLLLWSKDVDVNSLTKYPNWTPLHFAARHGHNDVVQLLVDQEHVEVNHRDGEQRTPFHLAVIGQNLGVLKILRSHEEFEFEPCNEDGRPVLLDAVDDGFVEGFRYLLDVCGMDPNCCEKCPSEIPLMLAVNTGEIEVVQVLVKDRRTWLFVRDENGETALSLAFDPKIKEILRSATQVRWGEDLDVMMAKISLWPKIRDFVEGKEAVLTNLEDLDSYDIQDMMHFFEKRNICGWENASAADWEDARVELEDDVLDWVEDKLS